MGLFDFFRRKNADPLLDPTLEEDAPAPAPPPSPAGFLAVGEEEWDDWDDDARMAWCMRQFEVLRREYGGDGKLRRSTADETIALRAKFGERPIVIAVDYTAGWITLRLRFLNRHGLLALSYDAAKRAVHSDSQQADDGWEDDDGGQVTHVFAPGVYLQEYEVEARPMIALFEALPSELRDALVRGLQGPLSRILVDAEMIEVSLKKDFQGLGDPKAEFDGVFALLDRIARAFAVGERELAPKPRVYMGGKPMVSQAPPRVRCAYCSNPYTVSEDDPRCPSCGATSA